MQLQFHTLDVFADRRFGGNPLCVVHGAGALCQAQMKQVARELNLTETAFVLPAESPAHTARLRIFTPARELPFSGHPTIGVATLLAELRAGPEAGDHDAIIALEQAIGTVRVGVRLRPGVAAYAEFDAPKLPQEAGQLPPVDRLAAGLGLSPSEIGFENHKPMCFAAGAAFAIVPVASLEAIGRARINGAHWTGAFEEQGLVGVYLYTRQCLHTTSCFHARVFAPGAGVAEDPATGSAAVCLAGAIHKFDGLPDGVHRRPVEQGHEMDRPSQIVVTATIEGGKLSGVRIGGHAVRVCQGWIEV